MEKGTNTRKKLLSDAFKLFSSNSYENVTFSELEKASGVSRGSIVYYFENKNGLFSEMLKTFVFDNSSVKRVPKPYQHSLIAFYNYFIEILKKEKNKLIELGIKNMNEALFFIEMSALLNISDFRAIASKWHEEEKNIWYNIIQNAVSTNEIRKDIDVKSVADLFEKTYLGASFIGVFSIYGVDINVLHTNFDQLYSLLVNETNIK
jgi:transcriptional regulator, TetR family